VATLLDFLYELCYDARIYKHHVIQSTVLWRLNLGEV